MNNQFQWKKCTVVMTMCLLIVVMMFIYPSSSDFRYSILSDDISGGEVSCTMSCSGMLAFPNTRFEPMLTVDYFQIERDNGLAVIFFTIIYACIIIVSVSGFVTTAADKHGKYLVRLLI